MIYVYVILGGLIASLALSCIARDVEMIRGAVALLLNWCVLTVADSITDDQYNVPLNMAVDYTTFWIGFAPIKQFPQVLMSALVGIGMLCHACHQFNLWLGVPLDQLKSPYWWRFFYLSCAQIAVMIGWGCYGGWQRFIRAPSLHRRVLSVHASDTVGCSSVDRS